MKKASKKTNDVAGVMAQIQEQLAVLDQKLDSFMTKSLTELAQALNASKPAPRPAPTAPVSTSPRPPDRPGRPMYTVVCFECGNDCEVPFKPSGDRPVYCKECFAKRKAGQLSKSIPRPAVTSAPSSESPKPVSSPEASAPKVSSKKKTAKKVAVKAKPSPKKKAPAKKKTAVKKAVKRK